MIEKDHPVRLTKEFAKYLVFDAIYDGFSATYKYFRLLDSLSLSLIGINVDSRLDLRIVQDINCGEINVNLLNYLKTHYPETDKIFENKNNVITHWCKFNHKFELFYRQEELSTSSRFKYSKHTVLRQPLRNKSEGNCYKFNHRIYKGLSVLLCFENCCDDKMLLDYILVCAHA